jgi:type II secretory pathway pseudopilin PulG
MESLPCGSRRSGVCTPQVYGRFEHLAMTLVEMTLVVIGVAAVLFLLIGWMGSTRQAAKHDLAVKLLADLDRALARYHRDTGCYPATYGPNSAIEVTDDLFGHPRSRPILEALPSCLWGGVGGRTPLDPWATALRYYDTNSESPYVKANNDRPVFVSAGPDRGFGDLDPSELGDNLRSDDPGPEGFRLHHVMRGALTENEEQSSGQEDD